jgi:hypothetical protein
VNLDDIKKGRWAVLEYGDIGKLDYIEYVKDDPPHVYAYWHGEFDNKEFSAWVYLNQIIGVYKLKREAKAVSDIIKPPKGNEDEEES